MGKTKMDKKVNNYIKRVNKDLKRDVFGDRFWLRQVEKTFGEDKVRYYRYEIVDNKYPKNTKVLSAWFTGFGITTMNELMVDLNNFIIKSDFWETYNLTKIKNRDII